MDKTKILVMEDDDDTLEMVRFLLARAGYDVLTARDGRAGLDLALETIPDLILLDMAMPEMDGWSVAREIKSTPTLKDTPVIAITAYTLASDRARALSVGCDGFIPKPMNVTDFIVEIKNILSQSERLPELYEKN